MSTVKVYEATPILGLREWGEERGGGAYVSWLEHVAIPGLEGADIRFEFSETQSPAQVAALIAQLKTMGFRFVVQR